MGDCSFGRLGQVVVIIGYDRFYLWQVWTGCSCDRLWQVVAMTSCSYDML